MADAVLVSSHCGRHSSVKQCAGRSYNSLLDEIVSTNTISVATLRAIVVVRKLNASFVSFWHMLSPLCGLWLRCFRLRCGVMQYILRMQLVSTTFYRAITNMCRQFAFSASYIYAMVQRIRFVVKQFMRLVNEGGAK